MFILKNQENSKVDLLPPMTFVRILRIAPGNSPNPCSFSWHTCSTSPVCRVKGLGVNGYLPFFNSYFQGGIFLTFQTHISISYYYNMISHPEEPDIPKPNNFHRNKIWSPVGWGHQWQSQRSHSPTEARDLMGKPLAMGSWKMKGQKKHTKFITVLGGSFFKENES